MVDKAGTVCYIATNGCEEQEYPYRARNRELLVGGKKRGQYGEYSLEPRAERVSSVGVAGCARYSVVGVVAPVEAVFREGMAN